MPRRQKRLRPEERRVLIEDAAARLFAEHGYAGTALEDIARAAQVTKPVLYRHFESKKALYLALLEKHRAQLPQFASRRRASPVVPLALRAPAILDGWFRYVEARRHAWRTIFRDTSGDEEIQAARREIQERARKVIAVLLKGEVSSAEREAVAEFLRSGEVGACFVVDRASSGGMFKGDHLGKVIVRIAAESSPRGEHAR